MRFTNNLQNNFKYLANCLRNAQICHIGSNIGSYIVVILAHKLYYLKRQYLS